jgi:hypothetical protein
LKISGGDFKAQPLAISFSQALLIRIMGSSSTAAIVVASMKMDIDGSDYKSTSSLLVCTIFCF